MAQTVSEHIKTLDRQISVLQSAIHGPRVSKRILRDEMDNLSEALAEAEIFRQSLTDPTDISKLDLYLQLARHEIKASWEELD